MREGWQESSDHRQEREDRLTNNEGQVSTLNPEISAGVGKPRIARSIDSFFSMDYIVAVQARDVTY